MSATIGYLDAIRARYNCTDYRVAKLLGLTHQAVMHWRNGGQMGEESALKVAALLDLDPREVMFTLRAEMATSPDTKRFWQTAKESVAATTLFALAAVLWATMSGDALAYDQMHPVFIPAPAQVTESLCIMFNRWRDAITRAFNGLREIGTPLA